MLFIFVVQFYTASGSPLQTMCIQPTDYDSLVIASGATVFAMLQYHVARHSWRGPRINASFSVCSSRACKPNRQRKKHGGQRELKGLPFFVSSGEKAKGECLRREWCTPLGHAAQCTSPSRAFWHAASCTVHARGDHASGMPTHKLHA